MKKSVKWLLGLACVSLAFGLVACGDTDKKENEGEKPSVETPVSVEYTLVFTDQDDLPAKGLVIKVTQGNTVVAEGETNAEGKFSATATEGAYSVEYLYSTSGQYEMDTTSITLSQSNAVIELKVENTSPNGTKNRPYLFYSNDDGEMTISVAAGATVWYTAYKRNEKVVVACENAFVVLYGEETLTPTEGEVEIAIDEIDIHGSILFAIVNQTDAESETLIYYPVEPGSTARTAFEVELNTPTTATVSGAKNVYFTWTATADGKVMVSSDDFKGCGVSLQNITQNKYAEIGALQMEVAEGDVINFVFAQDGYNDNFAAEFQFIVDFVVTVA